jgi:hypothetical protein
VVSLQDGLADTDGVVTDLTHRKMIETGRDIRDWSKHGEKMDGSSALGRVWRTGDGHAVVGNQEDNDAWD